MKLKIKGVFVVNEDDSPIEPSQKDEIVRAVNAFPALLDALKEARRHLNSCTMGDSGDVYEIINAAIEKATP